MAGQDRGSGDVSPADMLKKLEKQLTCVVCREEYTMPKVLRCFHTFCKECLVKLVSRGRLRQGVKESKANYSITCPICRQVTFLASEDVSSLQSGFHIYHFVEIRDGLVKMTAPPTEGACDPTEDSKSWKESSLMCPEHCDEEVKIYCGDCERIGCIKCLYQVHEGHAHHLISEVFERHKTELEEYLQPILEHRNLLEKALKPVDARIEEISDRQAAVEKDVEFVFSEVVSELEARKATILQQLKLVADKKLQTLDNQKKETVATLNSVSSCADFVEGCLQVARPAEVLHMKVDMIGLIKDLACQLRAPSLLKPKEAAIIKFSYSAEKLIDELKDFGEVYTYDACAEKCIATGDGLKSAVVGEKACAVLQTINVDECLCEKPVQSLECELVSDITDSVVKGFVGRRGQSLHSLYDLSYVPIDKGQHQLHVKVEGEHVRDSPFIVAVSTSVRPSEPVFTIHDLSEPMGVSITAQGRIIASQSKRNCISVFALNGDEVCTIGSEGVKDGQLVDPCGVVANKDGSILVADAGNRRLQRFSAQGVFLQALDRGTAGFSSPAGIAWNSLNATYYVTDLKNHCVYIVSHNLGDVTKFGERGSGRGQLWYPSSVACDEAGLVYVADSGNHRIQVFSVEGVCLRRFGREGAGEGCLKCPSGLAVRDGLVYVSEQDNNRVSVFSAADGKFLYCLGGRGLLQQPRGVAMDASGVLFVCNTGSNCLHLF